MKPTGPSRIQRWLTSLPGRIGLVLLTTVVVTSLIPLLFLFNQAIFPIVLKVIAIVLIGIISGFASRRLLPSSSRLLGMLVAFVAVYTSLWLLNSLTFGYAGIHPFNSGPSPDWSGLLQLFLGSVIAWLVLTSWQKNKFDSSAQVASRGTRKHLSSAAKARRKGTQRISQPKSSSPTTMTRQLRLPQWKGFHWPDFKSPAFFHIRYWELKFGPAWNKIRFSLQTLQTRLLTIINQTFNQHNLQLPRRKVKTKIASKPIQVSRQQLKRSPSKRSSTTVHFTGSVEHRCPFCLEVVKKKDPRGVRVCPICHTHHHADCWAVTGTCQVPHIHE
jgi:hypothetical protein